jgi:hypothetical protein
VNDETRDSRDREWPSLGNSGSVHAYTQASKQTIYFCWTLLYEKEKKALGEASEINHLFFFYFEDYSLIDLY